MIERMFESVEGWVTGTVPVAVADDDAYYTRIAAEHDLPTVGPDPTRAPAVVIADGERAPVTSALIVELAALDPAGLGPDALVGLAVGWARVESYAAARKTVAVGCFAGPVPTGNDTFCGGVFAGREIGAALGVGDGEADRLVHVARHLASHLPGTAAAMGCGELSWRKAAAVADRTVMLSPGQCGQVEARVLPAAAGRTPAQHDAAVRRAVERLDPQGAAERRRQATAEVELIRAHHGDGIGELFARMTSEDVETVWAGADAWARRRKAAGDPRTLGQLRVAALVEWAGTFLTTGHPIHPGDINTPTPAPVDPDTGQVADHTRDPATGALTLQADPTPPVPRPPTRHGRPVTINITVDLPTFLGLTDHPGELLGTGALIPAQAIRELLPDAAIRRVITDPQTGHLLDLGTTTRIPTPALAEFCAMRDVTPTTPTAGLSHAGAGDLDHITRPEDGGHTDPDNLHSPTRRWHRAKTHGGWTVTHNPDRTWTWTSPTRRTYRTQPHDYRLGP